ncbi:hypothetical protein ABPG75_008389 [Micractinium tetrahymenae]
MGDAADAAGQCRLLAGPAALSAQLLLAALALASLAYKRHVERPQRPVNIWALDVSKQAISMLAAHACGMLIAVIAHSRVASEQTSECSWYFVAFTFDTTIGLALTIGLHKTALRVARWWGERRARRASPEAALALSLSPMVPGEESADGSPTAAAAEAGATPGPVVSALDPWHKVLLECGNYGEPPSYRRWGIQLAEWVLCVVLARALCGTLVVLLGSLLVHVAHGIDSLFAGHPTVLLFFVMIMCPLLMNICQVLVQDLVLKWRSRGGAAPGGGPAASASSGSVKEGLEMEGTVAERQVSLLAGSPERSAALV